jgi:hypothetical protein
MKKDKAQKSSSSGATLIDLKSKIDQVRAREVARLIRIATQKGFFRKRWKTSELEAALEKLCNDHGTPRQSQLAQLEAKLKVQTTKQNAQERREDTRRKILLGSFLIAQMEHKPALREMVLPELEPFLDQHKNKDIAAQNKELLKEWLQYAKDQEL